MNVLPRINRLFLRPLERLIGHSVLLGNVLDRVNVLPWNQPRLPALVKFGMHACIVRSPDVFFFRRVQRMRDATHRRTFEEMEQPRNACVYNVHMSPREPTPFCVRAFPCTLFGQGDIF